MLLNMNVVFPFALLSIIAVVFRVSKWIMQKLFINLYLQVMIKVIWNLSFRSLNSGKWLLCHTEMALYSTQPLLYTSVSLLFLIDQWLPAVISLIVWILIFFPQPHKVKIVIHSKFKYCLLYIRMYVCMYVCSYVCRPCTFIV